MISRRDLYRLSKRELRSLSRRELLKLGLVVSGSAILPVSRAHADDDDDDDDDDDLQSPPVEPFQRDLPIPEVHEPVTEFSHPDFPDPTCSTTFPSPHDNLPAPVLYEVPVQVGHQEIIPGKMTEIWGYSGKSGEAVYPGPTFKVERDRPVVVRFVNELDVELSTHNHGGFQPSESDGFPNDFFFPGEFKDFCYPNVAADNDDAEFATTQWYHDHAMDITGENVYMGLAGFYLLTDDVERDLISTGKLPPDEFDIPLVLQDRLFDSDGSLLYDPTDHDGVIGDHFLANGVIQPKYNVKRTRYRFRILNGSNARVYALRLSTGQPFLQIGADTWLLPKAVEVPYLLISPSERVDVIIDFTDAPSEVFLTNHLTHELDDGRGPEEDIDEPEDWPRRGKPLIKFVVDDASPRLLRGPARRILAPFFKPLVAGSTLRPHTPIHQDEIVKTRRFEFERSHGAWVVNGRFFNPDRDDARPKVGTAEKWIIENDSGGWVHPIHVHLEAMQIQRIDGRKPPANLAAKKDAILLGDFNATVFIKFRTFTGRYVFHCHNVEHEDMRMMGVFNVQP